VSHLGGGFGGKCDFHFEGHVAALARAARRPVRLVLSRREEFIAPDKRACPRTARSLPGKPGSSSIAGRTRRTRRCSARSRR
jgi:hypothetical protein